MVLSHTTYSVYARNASISTEAAREGVDPNFKLVSQNQYCKKLTKFVTEFGHHRLCQAPHEELLRKLWFDAEGLESGFPRGVRCSKMFK